MKQPRYPDGAPTTLVAAEAEADGNAVVVEDDVELAEDVAFDDEVEVEVGVGEVEAEADLLLEVELEETAPAVAVKGVPFAVR